MSINLEVAVHRYLEERRPRLAETTYSKHRSTLNTFVAFFGADPPDLGDITETDIRRWRDSRTAGPTAVNKYMDRVRALYRHAIRRGWCGVDPTALIEPVRETPPQRERYSASTFGEALEATENPRDRAAIAVALELLLRGNEIASLRVGDVDLENRLVKVRVSKKNGPLAWDEMAISEELADEIDAWLGTYGAIAGEVAPGDFLFPRLRTLRTKGGGYSRVVEPTKPMAAPYRVVKRALRRVGVTDGRLGFHTIRRSAARLLFDHLCEQRGDVRALSHVSSLLHHENRRTTELYLGVEGDRLARNRVVRQGSASVLELARAETTQGDESVSAGVVVALVPRSNGRLRSARGATPRSGGRAR